MSLILKSIDQINDDFSNNCRAWWMAVWWLVIYTYCIVHSFCAVSSCIQFPRACHLFWTRSERRLSYSVWWVFLACTEQNLRVPWISTYSGDRFWEGFRNFGMRDERCYQRPNLSKSVLFSWGCMRHLVIGDVEEPNNWTKPITGHDGR